MLDVGIGVGRGAAWVGVAGGADAGVQAASNRRRIETEIEIESFDHIIVFFTRFSL
ncbi:MAG: hypothetical protein HW384_711 [Dehalococcoidia bacterium]|nr:hypothetical protein [Dehalococcoidia bacterium]